MIWLALACTPSPEDAPAKAARSYCQRAEDCGLLQEGERKESCEPNSEEAFTALWDQASCPYGFDRKLYDACEVEFTTWKCDDSTSGWIDIAETCAARDICK